MYQKDAGNYNVIVTNPDGRSDILQNAFTIGNAAPVVNTITPDTVELNHTESTFTINGQNFQTGLSVSFVQGSMTIPCVNPQYVDATKISCGPIAFPSDATAGLYDVKVVNFADLTSGILNRSSRSPTRPHNPKKTIPFLRFPAPAVTVISAPLPAEPGGASVLAPIPSNHPRRRIRDTR